MEAIQILLVLIYCMVTVVTTILGVAMANLQVKVDELEKTNPQAAFQNSALPKYSC